jgi:hypothetical protein
MFQEMTDEKGGRPCARIHVKDATRIIDCFQAARQIDSAGVTRKVKENKIAETGYFQGDAAKNLMHLQEDGAKFFIVSEVGKDVLS